MESKDRFHDSGPVFVDRFQMSFHFSGRHCSPRWVINQGPDSSSQLGIVLTNGECHNFSIACGQYRISNADRGSTAAELIRLNFHPLQHRNKQIAEWSIVLAVESQMLPVFEPTSGQQDRKVRIVVCV